MSRHRDSNGASGFTLVELLVSLTLLALLTVLLAGVVRTGSRAAARGDERLDQASQMVLASGFLRDQLGAMLPVALPGTGRLAFTGRPDGLDFIGLPPAEAAPGGFYHLVLSLEAAATGQRLVLRWTPLSGVGADDLPPSVLLDRLERVEFAYYGALDDSEAARWHDEWQSPTRLPTTVRLHFLFRDGHSVPDLVVALHLAQADWCDGVPV